MKQIATKKTLIDSFLLDFLNEEEQKFQDQELALDAFAKIKAFVVSGKTVRGALFLLAASSLDQQSYDKYQNDYLQIATSLELIHSGLLIHDDVIDQDEKRRGQDSIWHQYEQSAATKNYKDPKNYGQSLAICLGSLVQYLAATALEKMSLIPERNQKNIKQTINQEIVRTYFAEMLDSKITLQKTLPSIDEVSQMYLFKTARYTFSLPLQLAGLANELDDKTIKNLIKIGENLGLIFQIKDDEISLFAEEKISGKSFASDIKEGKKTIFYLTLLELADEKEKQFLLENYGHKEINESKITQIQELFKKYSLKKITTLLEQLKNEAELLIAKVEAEKTQELLLEMLNFNLNRAS